jgi:hypothetical protein
MRLFQLFVLTLIVPGVLVGQDITLQGKVHVIHHSKNKSVNSNVVVWLIPAFTIPAEPSLPPARLLQKDKRFTPHVLAIRVGTEIEFPNRDPFFHDVFSIYRGKPFDLGLYESGTSRKVRFSQPGVSYLFCNIHPEMSAAVVAVPTPYFAITSDDGSFRMEHLMKGHYKLAFWYELASPSELDSLSRDLEIDGDPVPVNVDIHSSDTVPEHLNKYGQEYPSEKNQSY